MAALLDGCTILCVDQGGENEQAFCLLLLLLFFFAIPFTKVALNMLLCFSFLISADLSVEECCDKGIEWANKNRICTSLPLISESRECRYVVMYYILNL